MKILNIVIGMSLAIVSASSPAWARGPSKKPGSSGGTVTTVAPVKWFFARNSGDPAEINNTMKLYMYYDVNLYGTANTSFEIYLSVFGAAPQLAATVAASNLTWEPST